MLQFTHMLLAAAGGGSEYVAPPGQQLYTAFQSTSNTYSFIVPVGVTSVSMLCVSAGAFGGTGSYSYGGYGGALAYKNNMTVTPGETLTVTLNFSDYTSFSSYRASVSRGGTVLLFAGMANQYGGVSPMTGYDGGYPFSNSYGGGGGAGGYTGYGGTGGGQGSSGSSGSGGAGGGGGGGVGYDYGGGGGGGVGLFGQGANGAGGSVGNGGQGGSDGNSGGGGGRQMGYDCCGYPTGMYESTAGSGGNYGGGHGGGNSKAGGYSRGAVRIIWQGATRQFPNTNVGNF